MVGIGRPVLSVGVGALVAALCGSMLVGCSTTVTSPRAAVGHNQAVPEFAGPWASLFASTFREASSADERRVLRDGTISDAEYSLLEDEIVKCLAVHDVTASFDGASGLDYSNPRKVSQEVINACMADNGIRTLSLRDAIRHNPENRDENQIMAECLRRAGAVAPGFTAHDYADPTRVEKLLQTEAFAKCNSDPLHYAR